MLLVICSYWPLNKFSRKCYSVITYLICTYKRADDERITLTRQPSHPGCNSDKTFNYQEKEMFEYGQFKLRYTQQQLNE